jgi:hypothetical protein
MRLSFRRASMLTAELDPAGLELWLRDAVAQSFQPDLRRMAEVREAVLTAHRATAGRHIDQDRSRPHLVAMRGNRWIVALATGLILVVAGVGVVGAEIGPGQPFYGLRLTLESLTLPAQGTAARFQTELTLLGSRLEEARQATARGDSNAARDALAAYEARLGEVDANRTDPTVDARALDDVLSHEQIVLTGLIQNLPPAADSGLQRALDRVTRVRAGLAGAGTNGAGNANQPANGSAAPGNANSTDHQASPAGLAAGNGGAQPTPNGAANGSPPPRNAMGNSGGNGNGPSRSTDPTDPSRPGNGAGPKGPQRDHAVPGK